MKKVGIFGGSFDPIHLGHIHLAISLSESASLDEVWFIPAKINPLKSALPVKDSLRFEMVQKAIEEIPHFKVLDIELQGEGPSFTIDTLKKLKKEFPEITFYILLGDDVLSSFNKWKDPLEVLKLAEPLIGTRGGCKLDSSLPSSIKKGCVKTPIIEISATDIRSRVQKGLYIGHLVPAKVLDTIQSHQLYSLP